MLVINPVLLSTKITHVDCNGIKLKLVKQYDSDSAAYEIMSGNDKGKYTQRQTSEVTHV